MFAQRHLRAVALVALMILAPMSGCFGNNSDDVIIDAGDITITPAILTGGEFQGVTFAAESSMSVYVPYLFIDENTGFVQNSTILQLKAGDSIQLNMLAPPRTEFGLFQIGEYGRNSFPIRNVDESWATWYLRDGHKNDSSTVIAAKPFEEGSNISYPQLEVDNSSNL